MRRKRALFKVFCVAMLASFTQSSRTIEEEKPVHARIELGVWPWRKLEYAFFSNLAL